MSNYATNIFLADGVKTYFDFNFAGVDPDNQSGTVPYLYPEDVKAQELYFDINGVPQVFDRTVVLTQPNRATIVGAPVVAGRHVKIYRQTEIRFPLVDYRDRQAVSEADLDLANRQAIFVAQETYDAASTNLITDSHGNFDAKDLRLVNLADGEDPTDAVNKRQLDAISDHSLRVDPLEPALPLLPDVANRANRLLSFDASGNPTAVFPSNQSATDLEARIAERNLPLQGAGLVGYFGNTLADLHTSGVTHGASMVYGAARVVNTLADLKLYGPGNPAGFFVLGCNAPYDGGGGQYSYDPTDTTTVEFSPLVLTGTGNARFKLAHCGQVTAPQCGIFGDNVTNNGARINTVNPGLVSRGITLFFPTGIYRSSQIMWLTGQCWKGVSPVKSVLKAINSLNVDFVATGASNVDDMIIENLGLDGNRAFNTSGFTLYIKGARNYLNNVTVSNSPGTGIYTDYDASTALRPLGFESTFRNIVVDSTFGHGWIHKGPSDSSLTNIVLLDCGNGADNTYVGLWIQTSIRGNNIHPWNRSTTTNTPSASIIVDAGGCTFTNSHFEGGHCPMKVNSSLNIFDSCHWYAPRGLYALEIYGTANKFSGCFGAVAFGGNLVYRGILLQGTANIINVTDAGCIGGAIDFTGSGGHNRVEITGFRSTGVAYQGLPHANDEVKLAIAGAGGGQLSQGFPFNWISATVGVTTGAGALTNATATRRYFRVGKTVFIQYTISIIDNGSGANHVQVDLPFAASGFVWDLGGRSSNGGVALQGNILAGSSFVRVFTTANAYPGGTGVTLTINGSYETA